MLQSIASTQEQLQPLPSVNLSELGALHNQRLETLAVALELRKKLSQNQTPLPDLLQYLPWDSEEREIQRFNLYGELPSRLQGDESELALWLLSQPLVQRLRLASVLLTESLQSQSLLQEMTKTICSLEAAQSFVDALVNHEKQYMHILIKNKNLHMQQQIFLL